MTESLPAPLTDASADVGGISGFILDTVRLLSSELVAISTGDEFKAAVLLWSHAWQQKPAASLPDDDRVLAHFAGLTGNLTKWRKVRAMAMRGFVKCSDGRWYHPILAEDARRAAKARQQRRDAIAKRYEKPSEPPMPEPTGKPTAVATTEHTAELPVQFQSSTETSTSTKDLKNLGRDLGSGGVATLRPGSKSLKPRGIDWGAVVTRMQSHGFTAEEAWTICSGIGDDESYGRRMQGAMRDAEARGKIAYLSLTTIANEAANSRRTA